MFDVKYLNSLKFRTEPFKDGVYVISNKRDLDMLKEYILSLKCKDGLEAFDRVGANHDLFTLSEYGTANTHVVYLPILERQKSGQSWMYMQTVFARYATQIAVSTVQTAGYAPMTESTMFVHLVGRIMERITHYAEKELGGELSISSDATRYLDVNLSHQQQGYLDLVRPRTLTDLARVQHMVETTNQVELTDTGWSATTYFY